MKRLILLGTPEGATERCRLASHVRERDIPSADVCLLRAQQMQHSLEMLQQTGQAPGLSRKEQLSDSFYLGSYLDHLALFSSGWSVERCHVVVELMDDDSVNVQKWESIDALGSNGAMHHSLTYKELRSLILTYGSRLTCATLDHGPGGLRSTYHHYSQSHRFTGQSSALLDCVFGSNFSAPQSADLSYALRHGLSYALRQLFIHRFRPTDHLMQPTGFGGYLDADIVKPSAAPARTELPIPDGESLARIHPSVGRRYPHLHPCTHACADGPPEPATPALHAELQQRKQDELGGAAAASAAAAAAPKNAEAPPLSHDSDDDDDDDDDDGESAPRRVKNQPSSPFHEEGAPVKR